MMTILMLITTPQLYVCLVVHNNKDGSGDDNDPFDDDDGVLDIFDDDAGSVDKKTESEETTN